MAGLIRAFGDWDLAEESAQEAFTRALEHWRKAGSPQNPGAWLMKTARNVAIDRLRRSARAPTPSGEAGMELESDPPFSFEESGIAGYGASRGGELVRADLCTEAIRLARLLMTLMPDEAEARGLLALMFLHDSRRLARTDGNGDLVPLESQDRDRWDPVEIAEGCELLEEARRFGRPGPYQLQAAIARCHALAATPAQTDWAVIAKLYEQLATFSDSPVVALNHAVAIGMRDGPEAGLRAIDDIPELQRLAGYHLLPAARADLLRRSGRRQEAAAHYRHALDLVGNELEERYLRRRLHEVSGTPDR